MSRSSLLRLAAGSSGQLSNAARDGHADAELADRATRLYHDEAPTAVAYCALEAWCEGNKDEYALWFRIFRRLRN